MSIDNDVDKETDSRQDKTDSRQDKTDSRQTADRDNFVREAFLAGKPYREIAKEGQAKGYKLGKDTVRKIVERLGLLHNPSLEDLEAGNESQGDGPALDSGQPGKQDVRTVSQLKDLTDKRISDLEGKLQSSNEEVIKRFNAIMAQLGVEGITEKATLHTEMPVSPITVKIDSYRLSLFEAWKASHHYEKTLEEFIIEAIDYFFMMAGVDYQYVERKRIVPEVRRFGQI